MGAHSRAGRAETLHLPAGAPAPALGLNASNVEGGGCLPLLPWRGPGDDMAGGGANYRRCLARTRAGMAGAAPTAAAHVARAHLALLLASKNAITLPHVTPRCLTGSYHTCAWTFLLWPPLGG